MASNAIFLSYRRSDAPDAVDRIFERLEEAFGVGTCFMDVDTPRIGTDFREHILDALSECVVFLAVVGPHWLAATADDGSHRLHNTSDWVRIEIATALSLGIPVIPVLVSGATIPTADQVPDDLVPLCTRGAASVRRNPDFHRDMDRLVKQVRVILNNPHTQTTLRKEFEQLKRDNEQLQTELRTQEQQKRAALAEIAEREKEVREIAERAAEEINELKAAVEGVKKELNPSERQRGLKLAEVQDEADRLADLAGAEEATRKENEVKALALLDYERNEEIRKEEYKKLESLLASFRAPSSPTRESISLPTSEADYHGTDLLQDRSPLDTEARRIASKALPRTPATRRRLPSPPRTVYNIEGTRRASGRTARRIASSLSTLQPTIDMGLAVHYATQIVRQQGDRSPIVVPESFTPRLGQYANSLPMMPRVTAWFLDIGDTAVHGDPIVTVRVAGGQTVTINAPDSIRLLSRLVEPGGYVPSSGVVGYLQPI